MASIRVKEHKNKKSGELKKYFYIIGRDKSGSQCTLEICKSKQEAERKLPQYNGDISYDYNITIERIFDIFKIKTAKYSPRTKYNYDKLYNKYIKPIESYKYKKLNGVFLQEFFDKIQEHSAHSAANCLKMFKAAVNNAIKKQLIKDNKLNCVDSILLPKPNKNPLNIEELYYVLNKAKELLSKRDFVIIYTLVGSGLRQGELFALNKSDFNFKNLSFLVNKQYSSRIFSEKIKEFRFSSEKTVYVCKDLANTLVDYMNEFEGELLFPNSMGGYIDANNFRQRVWKPFLKEIGITKRVRLHDLRATFINLTLSQRVSIKFTQDNVGHSKSETTLNEYAENNSDMIADAVDKINNVFTACWKNVGKISEKENSNVIQFPKRTSA